MPKTAHSFDGAALRILEDLTGFDLDSGQVDTSEKTKQLLASQLGADVIDEVSDGPSVEQVLTETGLAERLQATNFSGWMSHAQTARGCTKPVRLAGSSTTVNTATGEVIDHVDTNSLPDGVIYKACGNRREASCPACSQVYKYDTYQLIKAGMAGGKGVPESVTSHPALFVTLTAPSFGPVHTRIQKKINGSVAACRPHFRDKPVCPHGRPLYCAAKHAAGDKRLGTPLCADCYDHTGHVVWNLHAPQLWARTTINWTRALAKVAKAHGTTVRVRFAKVAEFQTRGLVHFHALLRLDGHDPGDPGQVLPPPACVTAAMFQHLITDAVTETEMTTPTHPDTRQSWRITWGKQVDVRIVRTGITGSDAITETQVAGYLAKYATKATETTGLTLRRLDGSTVKHYANPAGNHLARLIHAAWTLGQPDPQYSSDGLIEPGPFEGLRRGAHQYGFTGHFSTKSRQYSTTLGRLRVARRVATIRGNPAAATVIDLSDEHEDHATITLADWTYQGSGWLTIADAALAMRSADAARARKPYGTNN